MSGSLQRTQPSSSEACSWIGSGWELKWERRADWAVLGGGPVFEGGAGGGGGGRGGQRRVSAGRGGWNQGYADMESGAVLVRDRQEFGGPDHSLQRWAGRGEGGIREGTLGALCLTGGRGWRRRQAWQSRLGVGTGAGPPVSGRGCETQAQEPCGRQFWSGHQQAMMAARGCPGCRGPTEAQEAVMGGRRSTRSRTPAEGPSHPTPSLEGARPAVDWPHVAVLRRLCPYLPFPLLPVCLYVPTLQWSLCLPSSSSSNSWSLEAGFPCSLSPQPLATWPGPKLSSSYPCPSRPSPSTC